MTDMIFKGCGTALVTPFKDGEVDYEAYAALIERQVEAGVDFLVPLATTAETPTLSAEEKVALLKLTYGLAAGKPLLVGCGSNSVPGTLANMKLVDGPEVSAWLVVVPFYNKPTQEGLFLYYKTLAEQTDKPIMIYNVPGRTGSNMTAATCLRIAREVPGIIGIKEASGKLDQIKEILEGAPEGFAVLSGDDDMTVDIMENGGNGVISVASNALPAEVTALAHACLDGNFEEARKMEAGLHDFFVNCFIESNPVPVKAALSLMGLCSAEVRLPLTEATENTKQILKGCLR